MPEPGQLHHRKARDPKAIKKFQQKLVSKLMKANPLFLADCEFRPVRSALELKMAAHLVYLEYRRVKYSLPNKGQMRMSIHQVIKRSTTLVAVYKKKYIMGTMTLMEDSPLGLPMDKIYRGELDVLRQKGRRLFETGMLAMNKALLDHPDLAFSQTNRMILILHLIRCGVNYVRTQTNWDMTVICVHPKHEFFYRGIKFEPLGGLKTYESVQENPALAFCWDFTELERTATGQLQRFFGFGRLKQPFHLPVRSIPVNIRDFGKMYISTQA
jgi:hypothetical protein